MRRLVRGLTVLGMLCGSVAFANEVGYQAPDELGTFKRIRKADQSTRRYLEEGREAERKGFERKRTSDTRVKKVVEHKVRKVVEVPDAGSRRGFKTSPKKGSRVFRPTRERAPLKLPYPKGLPKQPKRL